MSPEIILLVEAMRELMRGIETNSPPHRIANFTRVKNMLATMVPNEDAPCGQPQKKRRT